MRQLYFLLSAILLVSCATTRSTHTDIAKTKQNNKTVESKDSVGLSKFDSTGNESKDSTGVSEKNESDSSSVGLEFAEEDSSAASGPVKIIISGDTLLVDPGGRKLKGVKYNNQSKKSSSDSSRVISNSLSQKTKSDSSITSGKKLTHLQSETFSKNKVTERKTSYWPPWWVWAIAVIILVMYIRYRRWKKKPGKGLPVFENPPPLPEKKIPDKDNFSSTPMI